VIPRLAPSLAQAADLVRRLRAQQGVAALAVAQEMGRDQPLETETLLTQVRLKEIMVAHKAVLSAVAAAREALVHRVAHHWAVLVAQEQRHQLAARLLLMPVAVAVDGLVALRLHRVAVAEQADQIPILLMAPPTQAAAAVELMPEMLKTAAPAS
jgi:hypothetical protein